MPRRKGSPGSLTAELVAKAKEAAVAAVRVYNDPATRFKSETFIVLMAIAWTYLLHAHYRQSELTIGTTIWDPNERSTTAPSAGRTSTGNLNDVSPMADARSTRIPPITSAFSSAYGTKSSIR